MDIDRKISMSDFSYRLPADRIAAFPLVERDGSKLLVYRNGNISDDHFLNLAGHLESNSLLVFNDTRVIRARILFPKSSGTIIEVFCLEPSDPADYQLSFGRKGSCTWKCMIGNLKRWKDPVISKKVIFEGREIVLYARRTGEDEVVFTWDPQDMTFAEVLHAQGNIPIPPYLDRKPEEIDDTRYQTIYARPEGSVAAPTAGLHFTGRVLESLAAKGLNTETITLHVGAGTFVPVKSPTIEGHSMHAEHFFITAEALQNIIRHCGQINAVGTTSVRTLESLYWLGVKLLSKQKEKSLFLSQWEAYELKQDIEPIPALEAVAKYMTENRMDILQASTRLIIIPGYRFRMVQAMITNYHLPGSTLLLLVAAFTGNGWKNIYRHALDNDYRFLSYGDSSLLIPGKQI